MIVDEGSGWKLIDVAPSYAAFLSGRGGSSILRHRGSTPDAADLVAAAKLKAGSEPDIVAVDMPLSMSPIIRRRHSDNLVSSAYGAKHASTHTPSETRPGMISDNLRAGFETIGYPLATTQLRGRDLIEVYPHPALIELAAAERRLPYKIAKIRKYWPDDAMDVRRRKILEIWGHITALLDAKIQGVAATLRLPAVDARGYQMKAFEDALDAVVCAWIGACVLDGRAKAYGDGESAIWVPR